MNIRKLIKFFNCNIFYLLLILLILSFAYSNTAIAQNTSQQQSANTAEHFSLVLLLDPEGEATVNYSFQQNNLFAFVYGKSNLKVINLDTENIVYEISYPESSIYHPFLMDDYLIYIIAPGNNGLNYETIKVDLSSGGLENIHFPGSFRQTTDDGNLIIFNHGICQIIESEEGQVLFEPEVSKGGEILCVDDVIIFPFDDSRGNNAGYKAMSTNGEVKFTLEESFNEVRIFLPEYHSKISTFPLPILICNNYNDPSEKQWLLKFINKEGQTIASYSPTDLGIEYAYEYLGPTPLRILDENQNNILIQIRYYKQGEPQGYYYILTNLSGNILKIFDENVFDETNAGGFDHQGNILLFQNRDGPLRDILNYYQQDGTLIFGKQIPSVVISRNFKFLSDDEILAWTYNQFEKYSLISGELTGIYPISMDYQIYLDDTIVYNNQVYFFAKSRGGVEPPIPGSNLFSFSAADSGWLNIELVSIKPNAGTIYEVYNNTAVRVKFKTEYGSSFGKNLTVNFEKGTASAVNNNLEYLWHTPIILNGNEDTSKITVSYGQVKEEFVINIINPHPPTAAFEFSPSSPKTGQSIDFDSKSFDIGEGNGIDSYHWDFGDGDTTECLESSIDHIFSQAGEYIVTLRVEDNHGGTAQISQNIEVVDVIEAIEASLQIMVLDGEIPLEGVNATLLKNTDTDFITTLTTETDGTCEFLNLEVVDYRVLLDLDQEEGYIPPGIREVTLAEGANSVEINIEPSKRFGVAFFKNAPPGPLGRAVPEGHPNPSKSEWRPVWVSDKSTFNMPKSQYLVRQDSGKQENYTSSASNWESSLPGTTLFSNSQYILEKGPSTVWRRYDLTLFEKVNGTPIVVALDFGDDPLSYQYKNPYAFTGTLSASELQGNWYLDPFKRWVVMSALCGGLPDSGNWGVYNDMATFWGKEFGPAYTGGQSIGTVGVGLYLGLLVIEYFAIIEYNKLVIELENDYQNRYHCSSTEQIQNNYFSLVDTSLGKPVIVRRDIPNYTMPRNVTTSSETGADCIDGFTIQARTTEINTTQLEPKTASKVVAINKAFTYASIPFQFVLRVNTDGGDDATAQVKGHFFVRLRLPSIDGDSSRPERWVKLDVAGIKNDQWLSPWESIRTRIDTQTYMCQDISTSLSESGAQDLLLAWAGDVTLRANDFGVDRFEEIEFGIEIETDNYNSAISESAKADATLSVQPIFSRNIAEAGLWKAVSANTSVDFIPNANFLPNNVQSVIYEWYLDDEVIHTATVEGLEGNEQEWVKRSDASTSHTFSEPGIYTLWLKVDPDVPEDADNADLFNNVDTGVSYDICKVWVYQSP